MMIGTSRSKQPRGRLAALVVAVAVVCGTPAMANMLVTRDGSVIEARGSWKVQGRLVVFELPDGRLASLQLGEVNLEASRAAARKTPARARAGKARASRPPERTAVLVLTDADVRQAPDAAAAAEEPMAGSGQADEPLGQEERLVVSSWQETTESDGLVITGMLVNKSPDVVADIQLAVLFYDRDEELLKTTLATVTSQVLKPGQQARFRAEARGVFDYSSLRFEAGSLGLCGQLRDRGPCGAG